MIPRLDRPPTRLHRGTPDRIDERAAEVLAGGPLPPGFDVAGLKNLGAQVTSRVGGEWMFCEYSDKVAAGNLPPYYKDALGC